MIRRFLSRWTAKPRTLAETLRPDNEYRRRRMEHLSPERLSRATAAAMCVNDRAFADRYDAARRARIAEILA